MVAGTERRAQRRWEGLPCLSAGALWAGVAIDGDDQPTGVLVAAQILEANIQVIA